MKLKDLFKKVPKKNRWTEAEELINKQEEERKAFNKKLYDLVYTWPTESEYGFSSEEQKELLKLYPEANMDKYDDAMMGNTCMRNEKTGDLIIYHCDVLTALRCAVENRDMYVHEWD
jgi:hypothetical protein